VRQLNSFGGAGRPPRDATGTPRARPRHPARCPRLPRLQLVGYLGSSWFAHPGLPGQPKFALYSCSAPLVPSTLPSRNRARVSVCPPLSQVRGAPSLLQGTEEKVLPLAALSSSPTAFPLPLSVLVLIPPSRHRKISFHTSLPEPSENPSSSGPVMQRHGLPARPNELTVV